KPYLPGYNIMETNLMAAIAARFGLSGAAMPKEVKAIDNAILFAEAEQNMNPSPEQWEGVVEPLDVKLQYWSPKQAERNFLHVFNHLMRGTPLDREELFARYVEVTASDIEALRQLQALHAVIEEASIRTSIENLLAAI